MKTIKYIAFLISLSVISLYAQNNTGVPMPTIVPKSPEVMGIERYGEYPVSEYTGIPSINIPLHTIKIKDFEFPISLDYHAAGIQVTQEATWVGLGWNLIAGGCISTIPVGAPDGAYNNFAQTSDWTKILNYKPGYFPEGHPRRFKEDGERLWGGALDCYTNDDAAKTQTPDAMLLNGLKGSGERDIYRVSLPGYSFNISIHPTTKQFVYNGEKNKFKIEKNNWTSWTLTDEYGYIYQFSDIESYKSGTNDTETSTWYLTKVSYNEQTLIEIKYQKAYVTYLPQISEYFSCRMTTSNIPTHEYLARTHSCYSYYKQLYISSIVSPTDSIVFSTKTRVDLRNAKAADDKALALSQILIYERSSGTEIKRYEFEHDYFIGQSQGAEPTTLDYVTKRLCLTKLHEKKGSLKKGSYQFTYNTIALPYKTSFSQDFWGYYNGWDNSTGGITVATTQYGDELLYSKCRTLLPDIIFPRSTSSFKMARRASNADYITAGMLKSITYPTGGKTEFEFEAHRFKDEVGDDQMTWRMQEVSESVINNGNTSFSNPRLIFENQTPVTAKLTVIIKGNDYGSSVQAMQPFYVTFSCPGINKTYAVTSANWAEFSKTRHIEIEENIMLPVGKVEINTSVNGNMPYQGYELKNGVQATISYMENIPIVQNNLSTGAGVRIKSIKSYTDNNTLAFTKQYDYIMTNGQTSGKLLHPVQFKLTRGICYAKKINSQYFPAESTLDCYTVYELFSGNQYSYATNGCNATVGYNRVEVRNLFAGGNTSTGKTISEFDNIPSASHFDRFFYPLVEQYTNGKLIRKTVLDAQGDTLSVEKNTYDVENIEHNLVNVSVVDNYVGPTDVCLPLSAWSGIHMNPYAYNGRFDIIVYPTNSYTVHLTKKEETAYFGTDKVTKTTDYEYNTSNYQVKKNTETLDNSKKKITEYKYGAENALLQAKNMLNVPIEEKVSMNTTHVQTKTMNYTSINSGLGMALSYVTIKNGSNNTETRLKYENYDKFGNPLYITKDDATKVVYIWGYNYQYPIAEIKNFTYSQLTSIIPATDLDNIAKKPAPTGTDMNRINGLRNNDALKNAHVTTFWYKPSVGLVRIQDPAGKEVYFDYDNFNRLSSSYILENGTKKILENYDYYIKQ